MKAPLPGYPEAYTLGEFRKLTKDMPDDTLFYENITDDFVCAIKTVIVDVIKDDNDSFVKVDAILFSSY